MMKHKKLFVTLFIIYFSYLCSFSQCDTIFTKNNLGLYGGLASDLTYLNSNNRLFATVNGPFSIFYSDDSCKTWHSPFPVDSIEFECGDRGWGGGGVRVLTNDSGWVLVNTNSSSNELSASVISFNQGDSGSFQTLMDTYYFNKLGVGTVNGKILNITLTNFFAYSLLGSYICFQNKNTFNPLTDIVNIITLLPSIPDTSIVKYIAAANNSNGYPFYVIIDTTGNSNNDEGQYLYKYDGIALYKITLPSYKSISTVFTPLNSLNGDTIFISLIDSINSNKYKYYNSFDGGSSWNDITPSNTIAHLSDVDYSAAWPFPGVILISPGNAMSSNLGANWNTSSGIVSVGAATHPTNQNFIAACNTRQVVISTSGISGTFVEQDNFGYESVSVKKINRSKNKGIFYVATMSGLAYTTAYLNDLVKPFDKWKSPYGEFPINNASYEYTALAINPWDSTNVVGGYSILGKATGFSVTTSGPSGFSNIVPGFNYNEYKLNDIAFIDSTTVIAVTAGGKDISGGKIWESKNKGISWTSSTPIGFKNGNTIAVASGSKDTLIYIGTGIENVDTGYVWASPDKGKTWNQINAGPTSVIGSSKSGLPILDIVAYPNSVDTIYIAAGFSNDVNETFGVREQAFVKSTNGGLTYQYMNIAEYGPFSSLLIEEEKPDSFVYVSNNNLIYWYNSAANNSTLLYKGYPGEAIPQIAKGSILVGTSTGFYVLNLDPIDDIITTSTAHENYNPNIKIYPNPASQNLCIYSDNRIYFVQIYDSNGKVNNSIVTFDKISDRDYFLNFKNQLPSGLYCLLLNTDKGVYKRNLVIEK